MILFKQHRLMGSHESSLIEMLFFYVWGISFIGLYNMFPFETFGTFSDVVHHNEGTFFVFYIRIYPVIFRNQIFPLKSKRYICFLYDE